MQRINALNPETATGKSAELFGAIQSKLGMVPNMMRTLGQSPAALGGYLAFNEALGKSSLGTKLGELIALTVANLNGCNYCNSAHSFIGDKLAGIAPQVLADAREGKSTDQKVQVVLDFVKSLVINKGNVSANEIAVLQEAGYSEAAVTEIIAHVALNIFTNYFNNAANTTIDFPVVELAEVAAV